MDVQTNSYEPRAFPGGRPKRFRFVINTFLGKAKWGVFKKKNAKIGICGGWVQYRIYRIPELCRVYSDLVIVRIFVCLDDRLPHFCIMASCKHFYPTSNRRRKKSIRLNQWEMLQNTLTISGIFLKKFPRYYALNTTKMFKSSGFCQEIRYTKSQPLQSLRTPRVFCSMTVSTNKTPLYGAMPLQIYIFVPTVLAPLLHNKF